MRSIILILIFLLFKDVQSNSFSEIFGKEGESGVLNSKTRSLSYALQYLTVTGTAGYFLKQLHDNAFFEPLGFVPESLVKGSPLAYGKYEVIDSHTANIVRINETVEKMNYSNQLKERFIRNRYSSKSIEIKNNSNISNSEIRFLERERLTQRYLDD
jgi:hypothetical protein